MNRRFDPFDLPSVLELEGLVPPPEPAKAYSRLTLAASERGELMVARWAPGAITAPHDHGGARGHVVYVQGRFRERRYAWVDGNLRIVEESVIQAPAVSSLAVDDIHDVEVLDGPGLSVHVYDRAAESFRIFDVATRRTLTVTGTGAWPNPSAENVIDAHAW